MPLDTSLFIVRKAAYSPQKQRVTPIWTSLGTSCGCMRVASRCEVRGTSLLGTSVNNRWPEGLGRQGTTQRPPHTSSLPSSSFSTRQATHASVSCSSLSSASYLRCSGVRGPSGRITSPLVHSAEDGLDVQDGGSVDRFQVADRDGAYFYRLDHDRVQPDGVGPVGRARREHARRGPARIAARVHGEHVAAPQVQPGQNEHLVASLQINGGLAKFRPEYDPRRWRPLVALFGGRVTVGQRRPYPADRPQFVGLMAKPVQTPPLSPRPTRGIGLAEGTPAGRDPSPRPELAQWRRPRNLPASSACRLGHVRDAPHGPPP